MKFAFLCLAFSFVMLLIARSAFPAPRAHVTEVPVQVPAVEPGFSVELPAVVTVVAQQRPQQHKAVAAVVTRKWVCGPMEQLMTGGSARTCEWQ